MFKRLLQELQKDSSTASFVTALQAALKQGRIYEFLREVGRPKAIHPTTPNYMEVQAMQTAWSVGYNQCLDDIMLFREKFIEADLEKSPPKMNFGGLDLAVFKEDLTEIEANAIRSGKPIPKLKPSNSSKTGKGASS